MHTDNPHIGKTSAKTIPSNAPAAFCADDYAHYLDELEITEEQATELLQTLWNIMSTFVDIGWGVDTVQIVLPELFNQSRNSKLAHDSSSALDSRNTENSGSAQSRTEGVDT